MAAHYRSTLLLFLLATAVAPAQTVLPLTEHGELVFAELSINGRTALMLVDTGSTLTMVRSGFTKAPSHSFAVAGSLTATSRIPLIDASIKLEDEHYVMQIGVCEIRGLQNGDGVLGSDFLRFFKRVELDYKKMTLSLWK